MTSPRDKTESEDRLLTLAGIEPFARGGKRDCFVHPDFPDRCVKVARPGSTAGELYRQASIWKRLRKREEDFDESASDFKVLARLSAVKSAEVWEHLPRFYGWQETDLGRGLVTELIRDADGKISRSFLDYLWINGCDPAARDAVDQLDVFWVKHAIPSRSIGLHNIAAQVARNGGLRLVVIDGLGSTEFVPLSSLSQTWARRRATSKVRALRRDIEILLDRKARGLEPGSRGFLLKRT